MSLASSSQNSLLQGSASQIALSKVKRSQPLAESSQFLAPCHQRRSSCVAAAADFAVGPMRRRIGGLDMEILNASLYDTFPDQSHEQNAAKSLVDGAGAAATAVAAASARLGVQLTQMMETVPASVNLEMLQRTAVAAKTVLTYLGDQKTRMEVMKKLTSLLESVGPTLDHNADSSPPSFHRRISADLPPTIQEPSMLEVEIRNIVDESTAKRPPEMAVTVNRPALVGSVTEFIRTREKHAMEAYEKVQKVLETSKAINQSIVEGQKRKVMQEDLEASAAVSNSLLGVQKSQTMRRRRKIVGTAVAMVKLKEIQHEHFQLQAERGHIARELSDLQWDVGNLSLSAKLLAQRKRKEGSQDGTSGQGGDGDSAGGGHLGPEVEEQAQQLQEKLHLLKVLQMSQGSPKHKMELSSLQDRVHGLEGQLFGIIPLPSPQLVEANGPILRRVSSIMLGLTAFLLAIAAQASRALKPHLEKAMPHVIHAASAVKEQGDHLASRLREEAQDFRDKGGFSGLRGRFEESGGFSGLKERFDESGGLQAMLNRAVHTWKKAYPHVRDELLAFLFVLLPVLLTKAKIQKALASPQRAEQGRRKCPPGGIEGPGVHGEYGFSVQ